MDCIFCAIAGGKIPASKVFENEDIIAFNDINPSAPIHILVVTKTHRACFHETEPSLLLKMTEAAQEIIGQQGLKPKGYRLVFNTGEYGGQTVSHVHLHILGGAPLRVHLN